MRDAKDALYSSYIVNCAVNAFSSYTAIMLNILTIHAMRRTLSLPKQLKTLLLSLAVSDLGVGLLVQPFTVALMIKDLQQPDTENNPRFDATQTAYTFIKGVFSYSSFFGVVAISVDRFLAIHLHLRYQEIVTHKRVVTVVILIWIFSAFLSSIIQLWFVIDIIYISVFFAIIFGLCFVCTTMVYCRIYFTVRRLTNQIQVSQVRQAPQNGELANNARLRKTVVSTFYIYLVFLVCCLPEYCRLVVSINCKQNAVTLTGFGLYSWTLLFLNSSLNPVIYCWKMRHIRHAIVIVLRNIFLTRD